MALNFVHANQPLLVQAIITYIYADPGIGKSSLAHTADKPVVFDFDKGQHRVGALRRGTVLPISQWTDVSEATEKDLEPFNTIIVDTVGAMLDSIKTHMLKNRENRQRDGALTLKAQGLANNMFMQNVFKWISFGKDVVFIAHATEEEGGKEKVKIYRPDLGGKNRNMLYRMADVMGYLTSTTDREGVIERVIHFNPSPTHNAKNAGALGNENGEVYLPNLANNPTFLADLIKQAKDHINTMTPEQLAEIKAQEEMQNFIQNCNDIKYASELNDLTEILDKEHRYYLPMRKAMLKRADELKCTYNKEKKRWYDAPQFVGITDEQRNELQDLLAEKNIDVKGFCESNNLENLLQLEASQFEACKAFILNGCQPAGESA